LELQLSSAPAEDSTPSAPSQYPSAHSSAHPRVLSRVRLPITLSIFHPIQLLTLIAAVIAADRASAAYDIEHNPEKKKEIERERNREHELTAGKTNLQRAKDWAEENRYPIIFGFWVLSMGGSFYLVNRNPYLSGSQKLVQARMYAQGATLAVLLASFAFEANDAGKGKGRWETIKVLDPNDPEHKHLIEKKVHHERYAGEDQWRGESNTIFISYDMCACWLASIMHTLSRITNNYRIGYTVC
jgi:hypothetical protein